MCDILRLSPACRTFFLRESGISEIVLWEAELEGSEVVVALYDKCKAYFLLKEIEDHDDMAAELEMACVRLTETRNRLMLRKALISIGVSKQIIEEMIEKERQNLITPHPEFRYTTSYEEAPLVISLPPSLTPLPPSLTPLPPSLTPLPPSLPLPLPLPSPPTRDEYTKWLGWLQAKEQREEIEKIWSEGGSVEVLLFKPSGSVSKLLTQKK
jgi:hypothetical protein